MNREGSCRRNDGTNRCHYNVNNWCWNERFSGRNELVPGYSSFNGLCLLIALFEQGKRLRNDGTRFEHHGKRFTSYPPLVQLIQYPFDGSCREGKRDYSVVSTTAGLVGDDEFDSLTFEQVENLVAFSLKHCDLNETHVADGGFPYKE